MKKHASFTIAVAACCAFLATPVLAADPGPAKPAHHHHHMAAPAAAPATHHHKGKHGKLACGDYAYRSAEWNACHK